MRVGFPGVDVFGGEADDVAFGVDDAGTSTACSDIDAYVVSLLLDVHC